MLYVGLIDRNLDFRKKPTPDLTLVVMPSGVASRADYGFEGRAARDCKALRTRQDGL
jgi:hypothetical protein